MNKYSVLLYYCYTPISDSEQFREDHHRLCLQLNLLGRIIIAPEGINGTVSGLSGDCSRYMEAVKADSRFANIDFKIDYSNKCAFTKLHVRTKPEIVHSDMIHIDPKKKTGIHLSPEAFKKVKNDSEVILLDVRSNYEHKVGRFKNAVTLDIDNFRDFPKKLPDLEKYKHKKIITYCTGGIKCEKASAFLLENGFENVYQLYGGIIKYGIEAGGEDFEGKCYVFDNRITVDINSINPAVVSSCHICNVPNDRMVNCANPICNMHIPMCEECGRNMEGACSQDCKNHPGRRLYDGTGYYQKNTNHYDPSNSLKRIPDKKY